MRCRAPIARFRLYPESGTRYVLVQVWPTRAAMRAHLAGWMSRASLRYTEGTCTDTTVKRLRERDGRWITLGQVAEVNLYRERLGMEVVTHELFHATIAWGRRVGFAWRRLGDDDAVNADEERLTYVHGRLCAEFVRRAERAGLYDPDRWRNIGGARQRRAA
jgi:hypothetical protein